MMISQGPRPMSTFRRMMVFVDGENLVFNYQNSLADGYTPKGSINYLKDIYVWDEKSILNHGLHNIIRANYYTYATGNEKRINEINSKIKSLSYLKHRDSPLPNYLHPIVFKKAKKEAQTKGVDIQMTVDILSHIYYDNIDTVYLISGDGDYLPIISEITRMGKQVYLSAFSHGLNSKLEYQVDQFNLLDSIYFSDVK